MSISELFTKDHERCDLAYAEAEEAASAGEWGRAKAAFERFRVGMERHLGVEEELLFPAFEARTGARGGPTYVMRMEHQQMRALLSTMASAAAREDEEGLLGNGETLLVLMQQHNMKEEHVLYPMCDEALGDDEGLRARLEAKLA